MSDGSQQDRRPSHPQSVLEKARRVKLLVLDVDGVLTDGGLYFGDEGEVIKRFSILDGLGIKLLAKAGVETAIITGRESGIVASRAAELSIRHLVQGREDKRMALQELLQQTSVPANQAAYAGDDLPDIGAIQLSGLGIAVANAHREVKRHADYICASQGGHGAVREIADLLLEASGAYKRLVAPYTGH